MRTGHINRAMRRLGMFKSKSEYYAIVTHDYFKLTGGTNTVPAGSVVRVMEQTLNSIEWVTVYSLINEDQWTFKKDSLLYVYYAEISKIYDMLQPINHNNKLVKLLFNL